MAHSYTPGLKVLHHSKVSKNRRLPIRGQVFKTKGDKVKANEIVARTNLPGNVHMLKVANLLSISPADINDVLKIKIGDEVSKGDLIAENSGIFGFFKSDVKSPLDGTIESISDVTGQIAIRDKPIPVEIDAYVAGTVKDVISEEGVIIQADAAFIQGIFGIGGESRGDLQMLVSNRNEEILTEYCIIYQESQKHIKNTDYDKYSRILNYSELHKYVVEKEKLLFYDKYKPTIDVNTIVKQSEKCSKNNMCCCC